MNSKDLAMTPTKEIPPNPLDISPNTYLIPALTFKDSLMLNETIISELVDVGMTSEPVRPQMDIDTQSMTA